MEEIKLNLPFLIAGIIIFIGFLGTLFFHKTRIPDVLFLIVIGVLIGPATGWIKASSLEGITPYFARLALIIILFEGGLHLNFDILIKRFVGGTLFSCGTFAISLISMALLGRYVLNMPLINSLILGAIIGGTSSAIVIPLICKMTVQEETKSILSLESIITDILAVIGVIVFIEMGLKGEVKPSAVLNDLAGPFSIGIVAGIIFGLLWIKALSSIHIASLSYMTTLAAVLVLFGVVEIAKGSGAVAAFTFGLVLSNGTRFLKVFDETKTFKLDDKIEHFHQEFTFFIRTYFFVYIGLLISPNILRNKEILNNAVIISLGLIIARYIFIWFYYLIYKPVRKERFIYFIMLPKGLAAAVVASLPYAYNVPGTEDFVTYTILVILISNIFMVLGIFTAERWIISKNNHPQPCD
ncbi:MAG: cation:proton antiporter [Planctomycetota bacterium]|nr:cation:proton antiporter [Planctomycetota bacterium]MDI6787004.1 cation:proton antiporter [Planctomycetota bacterium]